MSERERAHARERERERARAREKTHARKKTKSKDAQLRVHAHMSKTNVYSCAKMFVDPHVDMSGKKKSKLYKRGTIRRWSLHFRFPAPCVRGREKNVGVKFVNACVRRACVRARKYHARSCVCACICIYI